MADKEKDIRDDEFRVIGKPSTPVGDEDGGRKTSNRLVAILSLILVLGIGILAILKWPKEKPEDPEDGLFEDLPEVVVNHESTKPLGNVTEQSFTEKINTHQHVKFASTQIMDNFRSFKGGNIRVKISYSDTGFL